MFFWVHVKRHQMWGDRPPSAACSVLWEREREREREGVKIHPAPGRRSLWQRLLWWRHGLHLKWWLVTVPPPHLSQMTGGVGGTVTMVTHPILRWPRDIFWEKIVKSELWTLGKGKTNNYSWMEADCNVGYLYVELFAILSMKIAYSRTTLLPLCRYTQVFNVLLKKIKVEYP